MYQWEFLIDDLRMMVGRLKVSDWLVLERVLEENPTFPDVSRLPNPAIAYVAVDEKEDGLTAGRRLDLFLLIYALVTGVPVTQKRGVGTPLADLQALGAHRVTLPSYVSPTWENLDPDPALDGGVLETRRRFLEVEPDLEKIIKGHIGLAMRFYFFGVQAASRGHLDELVIDMSIAAECLIQTRGSGLTKNFKRRVAALIADGRDRTGIESELADLYRLRGDIVHGEGSAPNILETRLLSSYVKKAIDKALTLRHLTKNELVQMLDQEKED